MKSRSPTRLVGRTILLTRASADSNRWAKHLEALGARVICLPCLETEPLDGPEVRAQLNEALATAHWLVLTSRRAVSAVADIWPATPRASLRIAVVGDATAAAARSALGRVDLVPPTAHGRALAEALLQELCDFSTAPARVVIAAAENGRRDVDEVLSRAGSAIEITRLSVYRTVPAPIREPRADLEEWQVDTVLLASPTAVRGLLNQAVVHPRQHVVTIGPSTTSAARAAGLVVRGEATYPDLDRLVEVIP